MILQGETNILIDYAIDFDGTIFTNHTDSYRFVLGLKHNPLMIPQFTVNTVAWMSSKITKRDTESSFRNMTRVCKGLHLDDVVDELFPKLQLHPALKDINLPYARIKGIDDKVPAIILTLNDVDQVHGLLYKQFSEERRAEIEKTLPVPNKEYTNFLDILEQVYGIEVFSIIGNNYLKEDKVYTGELGPAQIISTKQIDLRQDLNNLIAPVKLDVLTSRNKRQVYTNPKLGFSEKCKYVDYG